MPQSEIYVMQQPQLALLRIVVQAYGATVTLRKLKRDGLVRDRSAIFAIERYLLGADVRDVRARIRAAGNRRKMMRVIGALQIDLNVP